MAWVLLPLIVLALSYAIFINIYLLAITIASFCYRPPKCIYGKTKLIVLIPAHNEEDGIGDTIRGLRKCNYSKENYQIVVLADNCIDNTVKLANEHNVLVVERNDLEKKGKGQALDWFSRECKWMYQDADAVMRVQSWS